MHVFKLARGNLTAKNVILNNENKVHSKISRVGLAINHTYMFRINKIQCLNSFYVHYIGGLISKFHIFVILRQILIIGPLKCTDHGQTHFCYQ
ncbi:hypothetical protein GDO86_016152 [Hymenochirus boettgeri]|uniref:Uncharacterized protein n=1 Tax=Hymenochirus boettgeri TaxID=247094 RepID=A0A8T2K430_9PIPI|nr:hypothetical protein GDO86_016152 [Hymenochirus boettgeri]